MPQSLAYLYTHIVFSTKNREPLIDFDIQEELFAYLGAACKSLDCNPLRVGGYTDHVHILCVLSKKTTLIKLLEEIKRSSSKWMKTKGEKYVNFYWQDGYAAFSVSPDKIESVTRYIDNQRLHHSKTDFTDECRQMFKKYQVNYDERYVWD